MRAPKFFLFFILALLVSPSYAQDKGIVLQNVWNNELNNYNPKAFMDKLFDILTKKLQVKQFIADASTLTIAKKDEKWEEKIKAQIIARKPGVENAYYIIISNDLRLPAVNLGKFLFKNPPRSSKLTFTIHVYDSTGNEVLGDTIINRGCIVKSVDEEKGSKYFYSDYNNFLQDMLCHLAVIRKAILEKPSLRK